MVLNYILWSNLRANDTFVWCIWLKIRKRYTNETLGMLRIYWNNISFLQHCSYSIIRIAMSNVLEKRTTEKKSKRYLSSAHAKLSRIQSAHFCLLNWFSPSLFIPHICVVRFSVYIILCESNCFHRFFYAIRVRFAVANFLPVIWVSFGMPVCCWCKMKLISRLWWFSHIANMIFKWPKTANQRTDQPTYRSTDQHMHN